MLTRTYVCRSAWGNAEVKSASSQAFVAGEFKPQPGAAFSWIKHPRPLTERRVMAHVLGMPAGEICDPVALIVLMETGYLLQRWFGHH